jgi:hypothetical protein
VYAGGKRRKKAFCSCRGGKGGDGGVKRQKLSTESVWVGGKLGEGGADHVVGGFGGGMLQCRGGSGLGGTLFGRLGGEGEPP